MSLRILGYLVAAIVIVIAVPAIVVGGTITMSFALPVIAVLVAVAIIAKVYYDVKINREFGRYSGANARDLIDSGVDSPREARGQAKGKNRGDR